MDFDLTEDQNELAKVLRSFLERRAPESEVRKVIDSADGLDADVWAQLGDQLGILGLLVPEEHDGLGLTLVEAGVVLEEMGRRLYASPFLSSSVIAASALAVAGDSELLSAIADGSATVSLATVESGGDWGASAVEARATRQGDGWAVDGQKHYVLDAETADVFLVSARTDSGEVALFAVDAAAAEVRAVKTLDLTRRLAQVGFAGAPARLVGDAARGADYIGEALAIGWATLAAEQVGAARQCLESAVAYANVREQFGQTIAHFQAVQHRLADILVEIEAAWSAVYFALWAGSERIDGWQEHARLAKVVASDALNFAAAESLHLHGGNGFTWEFPEHLYFRRARSSDLLFGSAAWHRAQLATSLGV
ncbi:MAG: acyl-CoA dehydrogenase protein [Rhodoglobus sp.]|nr:acyl-CoA dehydrogenase protein [Rhodoglobus sp.]